MFILQRKDPTQPDTSWDVIGWTDDRSIAITWRESSHRDERRIFTTPLKISATDLERMLTFSITQR
jgi:hypothetical protein